MTLPGEQKDVGPEGVIVATGPEPTVTTTTAEVVLQPDDVIMTV